MGPHVSKNMARKAGMTRRQRAFYVEVLTNPRVAGNRYFMARWADSRWGKNQPPDLAGTARCAYIVMKTMRGRDGVDEKRMQRLALMGDSETCYLYARDIPGAKVRRFQERLLELGEPRWIRAFAANVPGCDRQRMLDHLVIAEILAH